MAAISPMIESINEKTLNSAIADLIALVNRWQNMPTAGEIHLRLVMDREGDLKVVYTLNGQTGSADRPCERTLKREESKKKDCG